MTTKWLLPEGVDESLPAEAFWIETHRRELIDLYRSWGYELLMPPFIEYLDSLLINSPALDLQTFKLTDQLTGKMMGVRADMTPQVARIDAHRLKRSGPARYCYLGTVLKTRPDNFAGSRSPLQIGVEFYGHSGIASDLEVMRLMIETLKLCGIERIHIDLGHVGIINLLAAQAGLDTSETDRLFVLLQRKAVTDLAEFLEQHEMPQDVQDALLALPDLNGAGTVFAEAKQLAAFAQADISDALGQLEELAGLLSNTFPEVDVNFDLAELSGFRYQNGVVFAAYVPGEGRELARGGRYDGIGESFGEARAATGFSADLKNLMRLSQRKIESQQQKVLAPRADTPELVQKIQELRLAGNIVIEAVEGEQSNDCTHLLKLVDGDWQLQSCETRN